MWILWYVQKDDNPQTKNKQILRCAPQNGYLETPYEQSSWNNPQRSLLQVQDDIAFEKGRTYSVEYPNFKATIGWKNYKISEFCLFEKLKNGQNVTSMSLYFITEQSAKVLITSPRWPSLRKRPNIFCRTPQFQNGMSNSWNKAKLSWWTLTFY